MRNDKNQDTPVTEEQGPAGEKEASASDTGKETKGLQNAKSGSSDGAASGAVDTVRESAQGLLSKAKDVAGDAYEKASETAASKLDEKKGTLTSGLTGVAESLRQVGSSLRDAEEPNPVTDMTVRYGDKLAGGIEAVSEYFERKDLREIVADTERFARRNPAIFIGGAFALGLLAARFLKSSGVAASQIVSEAGSQRNQTGKKKGPKKRINSSGSNDGAETEASSESEGNVALSESSGAANRNTSSTRDSIDNPM